MHACAHEHVHRRVGGTYTCELMTEAVLVNPLDTCMATSLYCTIGTFLGLWQ